MSKYGYPSDTYFQRANLSLLCLFVPFRAFNNLNNAHSHWWGWTSLLNLPIQMLISSQTPSQTHWEITLNPPAGCSMAQSNWHRQLTISPRHPYPRVPIHNLAPCQLPGQSSPRSQFGLATVLHEVLYRLPWLQGIRWAPRRGEAHAGEGPDFLVPIGQFVLTLHPSRTLWSSPGWVGCTFLLSMGITRLHL